MPPQEAYIEARFDSIDRSIELFVVFAGWLFEWLSGSGDGRLFWRRSSVLATVVCFWSQSSASYRSGASLGREDVGKGKKIRWYLGVQRHV